MVAGRHSSVFIVYTNGAREVTRIAKMQNEYRERRESDTECSFPYKQIVLRITIVFFFFHRNHFLPSLLRPSHS